MEMDINELKKVELPKIDVTKYVGRKERISNVEVCTKEFKGEERIYLKVETDIIEVISDKVKIKASALFGLYRDENGNIGWGEETKLGQFLKQNKVDTPRKLIGKEVIIQLTADKKFLTFV